MQLKNILTSALLLTGASALKNLTALIASNPLLSGLGTVLKAYPDIATSLAANTNVTILAPDTKAINALTKSGALNGASQSLVSALLSYHVLPGVVYSSAIMKSPIFAHTTLNDTTYTNVTGGQVVEAYMPEQIVVIESAFKRWSTVVQADVNFTGGVVHIIDRVLIVPLDIASTALATDLTDLAGALTATKLLDTLNTAKDITVFAPSNDAFAAIGSVAGNLTVKELTGLLEYHVIEGTVAYSTSLVNGSVKTLAGSTVDINIIDGAVFVNGARVINADNLVANGVVHVIDAVLNPNYTDLNLNTTSPVPQFSGASSASLPALTSGLPKASTTVKLKTNSAVASGYSTAKGGAKATGGGNGGKGGSSSSSGIAAMQTGMVGAAALFGGAALAANW